MNRNILTKSNLTGIILNMLGDLLRGLRDLIYPKSCLSCQGSLKNKASLNDVLCMQCWDKIPKNLPPFCHRCGRHLGKTNLHKNICPRCAKTELHFDRAFSPYKYEGVIKDLIHVFKYKNKNYLGAFLTKPMVEFIKEYDLPINFLDYVIPVPLHTTKLREREFNQAQILGAHLAKEFKKELLENTLLRRRNTKTQTELDSNARFLNVQDSFSIQNADKIKNKNILLVDDVLTSGSTASEAAGTLKNAGAGIVFVLTLAN